MRETYPYFTNKVDDIRNGFTDYMAIIQKSGTSNADNLQNLDHFTPTLTIEEIISIIQDTGNET